MMTLADDNGDDPNEYPIPKTHPVYLVINGSEGFHAQKCPGMPRNAQKRREGMD